MARSWVDVARGPVSKLRSEAREFVPAHDADPSSHSADPFPSITHFRRHLHSLLPELGGAVSKAWTERQIVACEACGTEARLCANGCILPGNRSRRNRVWICAPCDHKEDVRISQMPYMDLGKLADPDTGRKEPFLCKSCHAHRAREQAQKSRASYLAIKAKEENIDREVKACMATLPNSMSTEARHDHFRRAYNKAYTKAYGQQGAAGANGV